MLAAVSLWALPRGLAYDPWSWLIWGREIAHLGLNTRHAATAVKPLPVFIDTLFAPTGSLAPVLWLLVARAATLLSLALVFRVARRLGGMGAGLVALVALAVSDQYLGYLFMRGMSEPMAVAAVLGAVDSQLESRRRRAFGFLIVAGLLRPEAWPFLFGYALWLTYRSSWPRRVAAVAVSVVVPAVWFVIDWFGSRQLSRSAGAAQHTSQGGPLLRHYPGLATIQETWHLMWGPVLVLFLLGFGAAVLTWARNRRVEPTLWIGLSALGWLVVDALLAQGRFATGASRYLLPGVALACVVAGVFVADTVRALTRRSGGGRVAVMATAAVALVVAASFVPRLHTIGRQVRVGTRQAREFVRIQSGLKHALTLAGGRDAVARCGPVATQPFQVPLVAWQLHVSVGDVVVPPAARGTVLQLSGSPRIPPAFAPLYRTVGTVGSAGARWTVLTTGC